MYDDHNNISSYSELDYQSASSVWKKINCFVMISILSLNKDVILLISFLRVEENDLFPYHLNFMT